VGSKSRRKGKSGELEVVKLAKEAGFAEAQRTAPMQAGQAAAGWSDVGGLPGLAVEVKRMKKVPVNKMAPSYCKADATGNLGVLAWRDDGGEFYATMRADQLFKLYHELCDARRTLHLVSQGGGHRA